MTTTHNTAQHFFVPRCLYPQHSQELPLAPLLGVCGGRRKPCLHCAMSCAVLLFTQGSPTCFTVAEIELTMSGAAKSLVPFLTKCLKTSVEHGGLDRAFQGVKVVSAVPGHCTFSMVVEEGHANM